MTIESPRSERKIATNGALSTPPRRRSQIYKVGALPSSGLIFPRYGLCPNFRETPVNPITSKYWNNLLHLLWLVLWADGKPDLKKSNAFMDAVIELKYVIEPTATFSREDILNWRKIHEMPRRAFIRKLSGDVERKMLCPDVRVSGHALDVITSMVQIALADGVYSTAESAVIKRTILLWNMPSKAALDIKYICGDPVDRDVKKMIS